MPSELKSETSRANGAKSHGPKTPEGKEASSRNSLKHGFTECKTFILHSESPDEYKEFLAEHIAIHQPTTPPEKELVEQMAIARWRIRRFVGAETVLIDCEIVRNRDKVEKEFAPIESDVHLAMAIRSLADESRCLSLMSRYESRLQRVHDKAYTALREVRQFRTNSPSVSEGDTTLTPPEPDPPPASSPSAPPASSPDPPPDPPPASSPSAPPAAPATAPSVSAGKAPTHNPSVSAGEIPINHKNLRNEPDAPPPSSPDIHLCTPPSANSEDHDT